GAVGEGFGDAAARQGNEGVGACGSGGHQSDGRGGGEGGAHEILLDGHCRDTSSGFESGSTVDRGADGRSGSADAERGSVEGGLRVVLADDLDHRVGPGLGEAAAALDVDLEIAVAEAVDARVEDVLEADLDELDLAGA